MDITTTFSVWFILLSFLGISISGGLSQEQQHLMKKTRSSAVVVGTVYCDTCFNNPFSKSPNHLIPGALVEVECIDENSKPSFRQEVKTDEHGQFKAKLPFSVSKHVKKIKRCSVKLLSSSQPYCSIAASATSSSLKRLKSNKHGDNIHVFSAGFFTFKPENQPDICSQKPINLRGSKPLLPDPTFPPPIQDPVPNNPLPLPIIPPLPDLPLLPTLPPLLPSPPQKSGSLRSKKEGALEDKKTKALKQFLGRKTKVLKPRKSGSLEDKKTKELKQFLGRKTKVLKPRKSGSLRNKKEGSLEDKKTKVLKPNSLFPPNPLNPPSIIPPNPVTPLLPPNPLISSPPSLPPLLSQPPVQVITPPSQPPPSFSVSLPPIFIGIPPASSSLSSDHEP